MVCSTTLGRKAGVRETPKKPGKASNKGAGDRLQVVVWKRVMSKRIVGQEFRVWPGNASPFDPMCCAERASKKAFFPGTWRARTWPVTSAHFPWNLSAFPLGPARTCAGARAHLRALLIGTSRRNKRPSPAFGGQGKEGGNPSKREWGDRARSRPNERPPGFRLAAIRHVVSVDRLGVGFGRRRPSPQPLCPAWRRRLAKQRAHFLGLLRRYVTCQHFLRLRQNHLDRIDDSR